MASHLKMTWRRTDVCPATPDEAHSADQVEGHLEAEVDVDDVRVGEEQRSPHADKHDGPQQGRHEGGTQQRKCEYGHRSQVVSRAGSLKDCQMDAMCGCDVKVVYIWWCTGNRMRDKQSRSPLTIAAVKGVPTINATMPTWSHFSCVDTGTGY